MTLSIHVVMVQCNVICNIGAAPAFLPELPISPAPTRSTYTNVGADPCATAAIFSHDSNAIEALLLPSIHLSADITFTIPLLTGIGQS